MTQFKLALLVFGPVFALFADGAIAHDYDLKSLRIEHPFTRATPPGAQVAAARMRTDWLGRRPPLRDRWKSTKWPWRAVS
jgi:hypothetical protein